MSAKLWTRDYVLALVVSFFLSMVFYLLMTTMAMYAVAEFGAGDALAGLASSIYVIGALLARVGAGVAVDALGRRRVLVVSLVAFAVVAVAYFAADGLIVLLVLRLLHGVAFGAAHTAVSAVTQALIPAERRAEGTGYHGVSTTLATAIGPFIAVLLIATGTYDGVFLASAIAAVLALGAALGLRVPSSGPAPAAGTKPTTAASPAVDPEPATAVGPARRTAPIELRAVPISAVVLVGALGFSGVVAFVNSYAVSLDLTSAAGVFFLVYAVVVIVLRLGVGRVQDARGDNVVIYPAIVMFAAGFVVLAFTDRPALLLISAALLGAGWGTFMSAGLAVAVGKAPISRVGKSISTYFLFLDLGMGLGPVLLGALVAATGYRPMYLTLAGLMLLNIGLYYGVHGLGETRRRRQVPAVTSGGSRGGTAAD